MGVFRASDDRGAAKKAGCYVAKRRGSGGRETRASRDRSAGTLIGDKAFRASVNGDRRKGTAREEGQLVAKSQSGGTLQHPT